MIRFLPLFFLSILLFTTSCKKITDDINNLPDKKTATSYEDTIVVTINDKKYYESDIFEFSFYIIEEIDIANYNNQSLKTSLINEFIDHTILYEQATREGFTPTDNRIDKIINIIKTDKGAHELKINTGVFATDNIKMSKVIQQRFIIDKLLNRKLNQELNISEDRLRDYYNSGLGIAKVASRIKVNQIFSTDIKVVEKALEELSKGFSFTEVAMRYSESPEAKDGGSLGYIERSEAMPEFIIEALKYPIGRYTGIIKSDYGYHIFYITGGTGIKKPAFQDIKKIIEQEIKEQEQEQIIKRYINELRSKNKVNIVGDINLFHYKPYIAGRGN